MNRRTKIPLPTPRRLPMKGGQSQSVTREGGRTRCYRHYGHSDSREARVWADEAYRDHEDAHDGANGADGDLLDENVFTERFEYEKRKIMQGKTWPPKRNAAICLNASPPDMHDFSP